MSDKPIQPGDLVVVVRPHCNRLAQMRSGYIFIVKDLVHSPRHTCVCGEIFATTVALTGEQGGFVPIGIPTGELKRIPPLDELEGVRQDEEISA